MGATNTPGLGVSPVRRGLLGPFQLKNLVMILGACLKEICQRRMHLEDVQLVLPIAPNTKREK